MNTQELTAGLFELCVGLSKIIVAAVIFYVV